MANEELCSSSFKMSIRGEHGCSLNKAVVSRSWICVCRGACIIEGSKYTRRPTFFNQITNYLIVEVFDRRPFNLLPDVFFLFSLERQLDEDLLQFLVNVVDAKLLE